jgi:tetratricopeptide (TPR) repeat protein
MPNNRSAVEKPPVIQGPFLGDPHFRPWLFGISAALTTFLFYLPTLSFDFVNLDDPQVILKNPLIHNLSWPGIRLMFTTFHAADWMPLTWFSFALNYRIADNQPWIYHLTNNILHTLNTVLVFLVVRTLLRLARNPNEPASIQRPAYEDWTAFLSALLFGLHPLHVESVAWVTERKDVLYGFFFLGSAQAYFFYVLRKDHPGSRYILCLTLFLCSLMSKTTAVSLPVVFLVLDLWPLGRFRKEGWSRPLFDKVPFFLISFLVGILSLRSHEAGQDHLPWIQVILKPLFSLFFCLWKAVFPYSLSPVYPTLPLVPIYFWGTSALGLLFLGACWASFRSRRKKPGLFTALAFYLVTIAPSLAILVQAGHEGIAASDRYTYLPLLGFFVPLAAWVVGRLQRRPWALVVAALALTAWLGTLTLAQAAIWKDGYSLWAGAAKVFPNSALIRIELGNIALNADQFEEAKDDYEFVVRVQPGTQSAYRGLGLLALKQGRTDEAITNFKKALSINGHDPDVWVYLWNALTQKERHQEALEAAKTAVQMDPDSPLLWNLLGSSYGYLGKPKEAIQAFQKALQLDSDNPDFLLNLGDTYLVSGQKVEAASTYREAIRTASGSEAINCLVGESYLRATMAKEALGPLQAAWEIKHAPRIAADLGRAYRLLGQKGQAKEFEGLAKTTASHRTTPDP